MIKAVFFDAIKTLFDPQPSELGLHKQVLELITGKEIDEVMLGRVIEQAMTETENLDIVKANGLQQWEYYPTKVAELLGCEKSECKNIGDQLRYETWGNPNNYKLFDDVLPILKALKERGIYVACVSNEDGWLSKFFDHFDIAEYFDFVLTSQEVGYEKPSTKIFQKALGMAKLMPNEVIFVGDSAIDDYQGSKAVGMQPLLIDRGSKNHDDNIVKIDNLERVLEYLK
jgi:HAD superfamily hydrolase (TIGR01549 family)